MPTTSQSEIDFLADYDAGDFDRPSLTVDVALLSVEDNILKVALMRRHVHPDRDKWALPGGFVGLEESLDDAAERVLARKLGVRGVFIEQLYTFGCPQRDPRARVVTVAYYALVSARLLHATLNPESLLASIRVPWAGEVGGPIELHQDARIIAAAFDHAEIIATAVKRLRGKLNYAPIGFQLLPRTFTLRRLKDVHECICGKRLNKDSFRRRMLATGDLAATGELETEVGHRPAELYQFARCSAV